MPLKLCFRARVALFVPAALALILFASGREVFASGQAAPQRACRQPGAADSGVRPRPTRARRAAQCGRSGADGAREQPRDPGRAAVAADQHAERLAGARGLRAGAVLELPRAATARSRRAASSPAAAPPSSPTRASARTAGCSRTCRGAAGATASRSTASKITTSAIDSRYNPQLSSNLSAQYVQPLLRGFKTDSLRQQIATSREQPGHRRHRPARAGHGHDPGGPQCLLRSDWRPRRLQGRAAVAAARAGVAARTTTPRWKSARWPPSTSSRRKPKSRATKKR